MVTVAFLMLALQLKETRVAAATSQAVQEDQIAQLIRAVVAKHTHEYVNASLADSLPEREETRYMQMRDVMADVAGVGDIDPETHERMTPVGLG
jgi:hypothetical protein